jgi:phage terminase small subunit
MKKSPTLSAEALAWVHYYERKFNLEPHDRMLLRQAAKLHDEITELEAIIAKEGHTVRTDRGGSKANPAVAILANNRNLLSKLIRQLDLNVAVTIPGAVSHSRKRPHA